MASSFWAFFREKTVPAATDGWIRRGHFSGASWAWDTAQIPFPDACQAYGSYAHYGYLKIDPADSNLLWVGTFVSVSGTLRFRMYLYDVGSNAWTLKLNLPYVSGPALWCCDMAFINTGGHHYAYAAIATDGAIGGAGASPGQGVYVSTDYGNFAAAGSGVGSGHTFSGGNVNDPLSLTSLTAVGTTLYAGHNSTGDAPYTSVWVTAFSTDGGATWTENSIDVFPGNKFMLEAFTVLRPNWSGALWYCASHAPTGASYPASEGVLDWTPGTGWGSFGNPTPAPGSIAYPFPGFAGKGVAFPTQGSGEDEFGYTSDGGVNWTSVAAPVSGNRFWYRAGRTSQTSEDAAGVTLSGGTSSCYLMWTEDAGHTWHYAVVESNADGLSLDIGAFIPPEPALVLLETLTFRDARMFVGQSRFYIAADTETEAHDNAEGLANLLDVLSNGLMTGTVGPYSSPPVAPGPGVPEVYQNIEMVIRLTWITADGVAIGIDVPAPLSELFIDDQESYVLLSPFITDVAAGAITYKLCTRGGQLAVSFVGATRVMRGFRSTQSIRTLDPSETSTAE